MKKISIKKLIGAMAASMLGTLSMFTLTANAVTYSHWYNRSDSHLSIRVYKSTDCTGSYTTVKKGTSAQGRSEKVNGYVDIWINGKKTVTHGAPNGCARYSGLSTDTVTVYVYPVD